MVVGYISAVNSFFCQIRIFFREGRGCRGLNRSKNSSRCSATFASFSGSAPGSDQDTSEVLQQRIEWKSTFDYVKSRDRSTYRDGELAFDMRFKGLKRMHGGPKLLQFNHATWPLFACWIAFLWMYIQQEIRFPNCFLGYSYHVAELSQLVFPLEEVAQNHRRRGQKNPGGYSVVPKQYIFQKLCNATSLRRKMQIQCNFHPIIPDRVKSTKSILKKIAISSDSYLQKILQFRSNIICFMLQMIFARKQNNCRSYRPLWAPPTPIHDIRGFTNFG